MTEKHYFKPFYPPEDYELLLELEVLGQPPRKSNSRQIVRNRRTGRTMVIKSRRALDYSEAFLLQIPNEARREFGSLTEPLFLQAEVYYKSNQPDLSVELVKDLLEEAGVVKNDRYIKGELLFGHVDSENPRTIIRLFRLKK